MKRVLILTLILALILPVGAARADGNPMHSLTLKAEIDGDVLDVRFIAEMAYPNDTTAFESMDFVLTYSKDVLELIELVKDGDSVESEMIDSSFIALESAEQEGRFEYHCASAFGFRGNGLLLHLRFKIIGEGGYGFRLKSEGFSVYDSAANQATSCRFPLLKTDFPNPEGTPLPESPESQIEPAKTDRSEEKEKNWFTKLMESIFGSSCRCGN